MGSNSFANPLIENFYQSYLAEEDTAAFIKQVAVRYTVPTLQRLAEQGRWKSRRAAVLALGFLADYESNHVVGRALTDRDRAVRILAENAIRSLWCRAGSETQRKELSVIIRLNNARQFDEVKQLTSDLIGRAPWFAEAWNQRAVAHFSSKEFVESIRDCHQTLEINPYHFGAATGMGYCYLQLRDTNQALECFRRALRLNPGLEAVRAQVVKLQRTLNEKGERES